jgi:16S rRNA (uracil1498-N3)-methyltransferase
VSRPLFLVDALPAGERYRLDGPEGHHAADVQRLRPGEALLLGDGRGGVVDAEVLATGRGLLELAVGERRTAPAPSPRLVVVQAIAKGDRGELAVQAMTEAGVDGIVPWAAARSVAQWKGDRSLDRWRSTVREASKQARRAWLPVVTPLASTVDLCGRVPDSRGGVPDSRGGVPDSRGGVPDPRGRGWFVLDGAAGARLSTVDLPDSGDIVVVVGPEGGIAPEELAAFESAGAVAVRLGPEVLRTSTAGVAALAVLSARLGRW